MGLERVRRLLALLKDPQDGLRIVQVVGTNGKGTTAVALAGALTAAGHPAGAYLSPHVLSYTERVMVEGRFVSERRFADAMGETILAAERHGIPLNVPVRDLTPEAIATLLYGTNDAPVTVRYKAKSGRMRSYQVVYEGVIPNLKRRYAATSCSPGCWAL